MRLERPLVVQAALELLNEVGLEGLTTRRLAQKLGVQGPALYWHFKNKQELIDEMARSLLTEAFEPLDQDQPWQLWLSEGARRLRRQLMAYRDGASLIAGYRPTQPHGRMDPKGVLRPLVDAFGVPDGLWALLTATRFAFGWSMDEQAAAGRSTAFKPPFDPETGFEFGLATIIAGLEARLQAKAPESAPREVSPSTVHPG
jgi:TetR/AcrR family tetracycline transcriptional repressor